MSLRLCPQCRNLRAFPSNRQLCNGCRTFNNRVRKGEILAPTTPDTTVDGYKEPMLAVEGGFGYYGALTRTNDEEKLQCHICGYFISHLGAHVHMAHGISTRDYKLRYGLRLKDGLIGRAERERLQKVYGDVLRTFSLENLAKAHAASKAKREGGWQAGGDMWTPETRNERGLCKEQTLAKIRHIAEVNNGVPKLNLLLTTYGEGHKSVIAHWFGSWDAAVKAAGFETYGERLRADASDRVDSVIDAILSFYQDTGRTPQTADFNSENNLPPQGWVSRHFGTLNKARQAAGVPQLIHIGGGKWIEKETT